MARRARLAAATVDPLLELVEQRHDRFNNTHYQLEPDIKQAPGGLRDILAARHLRALQPGGPGENGAPVPIRCATPRTSCCGSDPSCTCRPDAT